jgi:hypothetical protein
MIAFGYSRTSPARRSFSEGGCSMKITEDVRKYAAEQGIAENQAIESGMKESQKSLLKKVLKFTRRHRILA